MITATFPRPIHSFKLISSHPRFPFLPWCTTDAPFACFQDQLVQLVRSLCFTLHLLVDHASAVKIGAGVDPSVIKAKDTFYSVEADGDFSYVRAAKTLEGLGTIDGQRKQAWKAGSGVVEVWAPDMTTYPGKTFIHFSNGAGATHRMYVISADSPLGPYSKESKLALPDDRWAIDGTFFVFQGQG